MSQLLSPSPRLRAALTQGPEALLATRAEPVTVKQGPARQAPRKKPAGSPEQAPTTHSSQVAGTQVRCGTEKTANTPGIGNRVLVFLGSPAPSVFSTIPLPATPLPFCSSCPMSVYLRTSFTFSFLRGPARRMGRALELTGLCLDVFLDFVLVTKRLVGTAW